jgi:WD40 repeat protein
MRVFTGHEKSVYAIGITPESERLVSVGRDDTIRLWDLTTGVVQWQNRVFPAQGHLAISPDGKLLATAALNVGNVVLWNLDTGKRLEEIRPGGRHGFVHFSTDSNLLGIAYQYQFALWNISTQKQMPLPTNRNQDPILGCVAFAPDGKRVAIGSYGQICIWQLEPFQVVQRLEGLTGAPTHTAYSPDGQFVSGISGKHICVWSLIEKRLVWEEMLDSYHYQSAAFSPDGRTLLTAENTSSVRSYDTSSWTLKAEFRWKIGQVLDVTFAPDGFRAAASGRNGKIVVWDVDE